MKGDLESDVAGVVNYIRELAATWKPILAYSAWASSIGSLVNTVAIKMINDVFELGDIGVDEAEQLATLISSVESLDDLFLPQTDPKAPTPDAANGDSEPVPMTAQFADRWMKLKYLSEVLQSDLASIKYFWFKSHLSLYFTADEVVELIRLSFANNAAVRQLVKEIEGQPHPTIE
jgi:centromere/kinetochore protein ZW10